MSTTIQIQDSTKKALFLEKNRLERKFGRNLTYDDVIKVLLEKRGSPAPKIDVRKFLGTMDEKARDLYRELRKEYQENDF